jgi:hypothetical protein
MNICAAYIEGVVDALTSMKALCPPGNLAARQVIDIVIKHLQQHPEARPHAAASEAEISLLAAFPCKNSN